MFKNFKEEWPYYFLAGMVILVTILSVRDMLTSPLTSSQLEEIKTKVTAYNLEFVTTQDKQFLGCGSGHSYRVPVVVKNKKGETFTISFCPGNGLGTPSQIKI